MSGTALHSGRTPDDILQEKSRNLGGRLPLLKPTALDSAQKELYDRINAAFVPWAEAAGFQSKTADGRLIGPFNPVLFSPEIGHSFLELQKKEEEHTGLSERLRQVIILTVGSVWKAPYELYAHSAVARKAGFSDEAIRALAGGNECDELSGEERFAQQFTQQLAEKRSVGDAVFATAYSAFGAKGVVDMIVLAGFYFLVCSLLNAFQVPAPGDAGPDGKEGR